MVGEIEKILKEILNDDIKILPKERFDPEESSKNSKFFGIDEDFVFLYNKNLPVEQLYNIKRFLGNFLHKHEEISNNLRQSEILSAELEKMIKTGRDFKENEEFFQNFFSILKNSGYRFALIRNMQTLFNYKIDPFTLKSAVEKLQKKSAISFPFKNGELFGIKRGFHILIIESQTKIDPFDKKVSESKLVWLNTLYESKMGYEIDRLTGLFTRNRFLKDIESSRNISALLINVKNFKNFNEIYTSKIGDKILLELTARLRKFFDICELYRVYGDRFAVLIKNIECEQKIEKFHAYINDTYHIFDPKTKEFISLSPKIETIYFTKVSKEILEKANYGFKKIGKKRAVFEKDIAPILHREQKSLTLLKEALANDLIKAHFQFVKSTDKNGGYFEALMRIEHKGRLLQPGPFISAAKERGLYHKLNLTMLKKAFEASAAMKEKVSINIDIHDILQKNFLPTIEKLAEKFRNDPALLQFEILESENLYDYIPELKEFIRQIKNFGSTIALDDFGKGYSNFSAILDLEIDLLKIDRSLVKNISSDDLAHKILKGIASLCKNIGIKTTVEGVENAKIYERLKEVDIDYIQGFYISRPLPFEIVSRNFSREPLQKGNLI